MTDLDIIYFEQLKTKVQAQYLKNNTPSYDEISKWKGIDIIYFQEDLRRKAKGNISEKSFYTYFKTSPVSKLPRIDMLNILSIYAGYGSWYEFKKEHSINEKNNQQTEIEITKNTFETIPEHEFLESEIKTSEISSKNSNLQKLNTDNQEIDKNDATLKNYHVIEANKKQNWLKKYIWAGVVSIFALLLGYLGLKDEIFEKDYIYCFKDIDRTGKIIGSLNITIYKQNESPLKYSVKSGDCFTYSTKDKALKMSISSPFYENVEVNRNLENAPDKETIQLKPDDYKMAVYYFSRKDMTGDSDEQNQLRRQKQQQLNAMISDKAIIYQVYDSNYYGVETMNKQKYITLVTTPTTALKNLSVLEMKKENGKIVSIKFKIGTDEKTQ